MYDLIKMIVDYIFCVKGINNNEKAVFKGEIRFEIKLTRDDHFSLSEVCSLYIFLLIW